MFLCESAGYPAVADLARSAHGRLAGGEDIDYRVLSDLIGEASSKGVLRAMRREYSAAAFDAMIMPICRAAGERAPIRSSWRSSQPHGAGADPLTAKVWPLR
jgi:hypothetical protein